MDLDDATNFVIALLIGALVGIEREKKKDADPRPSFGGIRTHILLAELGAASAWLAADTATPWIFVVALAVVGAAVVASYSMQNRSAVDAPGLTSELAAVVVFLLGGMAVVGDRTLAVALAVITSALLAYKKPLHGLVGRLDRDDIFAGIKLLIASFIVLPLLPDRTIDPWNAINPYKLWLLVVLISALSLLGYVAMRWLGAFKGTAVTGITGGLVSSTAATLSFARGSGSDTDAGSGYALSAGILLAWLMMILRVVVMVAVVNRALLPSLWLPLAAMAVVNAGFAAWYYRIGLASKRKQSEQDIPVKNPFSLSSAIKFGALFAVVLLIVKIAQQEAPASGVYFVAALAGSVDVDAITLSMALGESDVEDAASASVAIVIAALSNTVVKGAAAIALGAGPLRRAIAIATGSIVAAGAGAILLG